MTRLKFDLAFIWAQSTAPKSVHHGDILNKVPWVREKEEIKKITVR